MISHFHPKRGYFNVARALWHGWSTFSQTFLWAHSFYVYIQLFTRTQHGNNINAFTSVLIFLVMALLDSKRPIRSLFSTFITWKALLLVIAIGSGIGPAYDTSSTLLSPEIASSNESTFDLGTKLTRWDSIYFIQASRRGYLFEQEYAFGSGLPTVISFLTQVLTSLGVSIHGSLEPLVGVFVAHTSHLLSVLILYKLGLVVWKDQRLSFIAASLHILSPAGIFLSAPYNESSFALLSFTGYLFLAKGLLGSKQTFGHDVSLVASGMWFGFATTFRSNGLFNGIPFAVALAYELTRAPTLSSIRRRCALIAGGLAIAIGFVLPQLVAYQTFCSAPSRSELRPWCTSSVPLIYSFVQERYWNVGFLRYWTPPNIPLFLLATPMLYLLLKSGLGFLKEPLSLAVKKTIPANPSYLTLLVQSMALSQLILAVLAITNYHIQIITRISSGYPLWYWWLAGLMTDKSTSKFGSNIVRYMVMYATIQGVLFASFLPPA
ncbi:glycosyltransferase family 76 protein [Hypoxylon trugodes]|uniref:glycosyltransferase family 76 protein n=1 Tax=Hypoxylon trugodes TaxID=326681 RepID=UPI00218F0A34|nr:glycosyltransferase family 76 protein [Hypoxylon trugodes]KAI1387182.1 glycosyltransferase family 76 protein [Hypoxylon trugodes]